ncbi:MAG: class I SAM-dependent methyltransferase [Deferribacterales bacterium]
METVTKSEKMWDKKAESYPRYNPSKDTFEAKIIEMIKERGVPLSGSSILDVGCGSGKFSIALAKECGSLHGIDISGVMLRILQEDALAEGVDNITTEKTGWEEFEGKGDTYDIVFCSTTPAVREPEAYQAVHGMARKAVVYLGWAGRKESDVSIAACRHFGIEQKDFNDTTDLKKWLDEQGIEYQADVIENEFSRTEPVSGAVETIRGTVGYMGIKATEQDIEAILKGMVKDGEVTDRHYFRRELIIWGK